MTSPVATGIGVVIGAQMAAEDFGGTVVCKKIEIVSADNQNKPDVGVGIVNRWLDTDHVDAIVPRDVAFAKLRAMVDGAALVRRELRGPRS